MAIIGSVLDQAQKLFGRSFVIAGFLPSLLFLGLVYALWEGIDKLVMAYNRLVVSGLEKATLRLVLGLALVYLLAYIIYGIRPALHLLYQGRWVPALRPLGRLLLAKERFVFRRRERRLDRLNDALTAAQWPLYEDRPFDRTSSLVVLSPQRARAKLREARAQHQRVLLRWRERGELALSEYQELLLAAHVLKGNWERCSADLRGEIDRFVSEVREAFESDGSGALFRAAREMKEARHRDWNEALDDFWRDFPRDARHVQPTRLGNIAMVNELYSLERYSIPLEDLWPRLLPLLPTDLRGRLEEANAFLDFTLVMSFFALVFAGMAGIWAAVGHAPSWRVAMLVALAAVGVSLLFYRLGIQALRGLGQELRTAVDLHRGDLFDALGLERPGTMKEEKELWDNLRMFFAQAVELPERYRFQKPKSGVR